MTTTAEPERKITPKRERRELVEVTGLAKVIRQRTSELVPQARDMGAIRSGIEAYYDIQELRMASANRLRKLEESGQSTTAEKWRLGCFEALEEQEKRIITEWCEKDDLSRWACSVIGIGPVIAAGLRAEIDFGIATNFSKMTRFCGLDPTMRWVGKEGARAIVNRVLPPKAKIDESAVAKVAEEAKRDAARLMALVLRSGKVNRENLIRALSRPPYNQRLKCLCWKIGDSFVKNSGREECTYGGHYRTEKAKLIQRNERGEFAEKSKESLSRFGKSTVAYKAYSRGRYPNGRIDRMARRKAVKLFLAHWWERGYEMHYGRPAPGPWPIVHGGHTDVIRPEDM